MCSFRVTLLSMVQGALHEGGLIFRIGRQYLDPSTKANIRGWSISTLPSGSKKTLDPTIRCQNKLGKEPLSLG